METLHYICFQLKKIELMKLQPNMDKIYLKEHTASIVMIRAPAGNIIKNASTNFKPIGIN